MDISVRTGLKDPLFDLSVRIEGERRADCFQAGPYHPYWWEGAEVVVALVVVEGGHTK